MAATLAKGKKWDRVIEVVDGKKKVTSDPLQDKFDAQTNKITLPFVLKGVHLLYMQHMGTAEPMEPKYKGHKEYTVQVLVTESIFKSLKKYHKKVSVKEYNAAQFEKQFGIAPPEGSKCNDDGEYFVIKFSSNATYVDKKTQDVKVLGAPRVLLTDRSSLADVMIGNGSEATVGFELFTGTHVKHGFYVSVNLKMFQITNLVEYVGKEDAIDDDDFDFDEVDADLDTDDIDGDMGGDEPNAPDNSEELADKEAAAQAAAQAAKQANDSDDSDKTDDIF